jgi:hypothetical protein
MDLASNVRSKLFSTSKFCAVHNVMWATTCSKLVAARGQSRLP